MTFDVDQLRARHAHCAPAICDTLRACDEIEVLRDQLWWWIARNSTTAAEIERLRGAALRRGDDWTALFDLYAAAVAEIDRLRTIVAALIEEPADTNTRSANGATPHTQSVECGAKNDPGSRCERDPGPADPQIPTGRIDNRGE